MSELTAGIRRAIPSPMAAVSRLFAVLVLTAPALLKADQSFLRAAAESNVNQRYTIESISIAGVKIENAKLPPSLRSQLADMVGERCDFVRLQDIASDLRRELHLRQVSQHLLRGSRPDRIRINFEVVQQSVSFELSVPKVAYSSSSEWNGELDASIRAGRNTLKLGLLTDGDSLVERFSGVSASYENSKLGTDRLRFRLEFEDYQVQRVDYRTRRNLAPQVTLVVGKPLTVSTGLSFQQIGSHAANALTGQLRYSNKREGDSAQQSVDTRYNVRAGTRALGSDFSYARHSVSMRYEVKAGRKVAADELTAGTIAGQAPSFERFVLGNKFAFDPLGGNRMVHNSLSYGYQMGEGLGEAFYDTGELWKGSRRTAVRHSVGVGYRQGVFMVAMAFPLGEGRTVPVFMAGVNY